MPELTFGIPEVALRPVSRRVRVLYGETTIADSDDALLLTIKGQEPQMYLPKAHVQMSLLGDGSRPLESADWGPGRYYTLSSNGQVAENAAWSYDAPSGEFAELEGHYAFDPAQVTIEVEEQGLVADPDQQDAPALGAERTMATGGMTGD